MPKTKPQTRSITKAPYYFDHEIAHLIGCSRGDARRMLKEMWGGEPSPTGGPTWVIRHEKLMRVARGNYGNFKFILEGIEGLDDEEKTLLEVQP